MSHLNGKLKGYEMAVLIIIIVSKVSLVEEELCVKYGTSDVILFNIWTQAC